MTRLSRSVSLLSSAAPPPAPPSSAGLFPLRRQRPPTNRRPSNATTPASLDRPATLQTSSAYLIPSRRQPLPHSAARRYLSSLCSRHGNPVRQQQQRRGVSSSASVGSSSNSRPKTAMFFPGQGVQKVGMLTPWLEAFPVTARDMLQEIDHYMGYKLSAVIQDGPSRVLTATSHAQPAIVATSLLILRVLEREFSFRVADEVDVTLGHSLGEFAALVASGYLHLEDSLFLLRRRAAAMASATEQARALHGGEYGMVAVVTEPAYLVPLVDTIYRVLGYVEADADVVAEPGRADDHTAQQFLRWRKQRLLYEDQADLHSLWDDDGDGVTLVHPELAPRPRSAAAAHPPPPTDPNDQVVIANINSKNQIVLSGSIARIRALLDEVRHFLGHDPRAVRLNSDSPFHSPIMRPAAAEMRRLLAGTSRVPGHAGADIVTFPGRLPCISNLTARPFSSRAELKELLARQCEDTVYWWDSIRYLDQQERVRRWVGIGPGKVGRNLVGKEVGMRGKDLVKGGGVWAITDPSEIEEVLRGLEETASFVDEE